MDKDIVNLVLGMSLDEGRKFNYLIQKGIFDMFAVASTVLDSGNAKAMYYLALFGDRAPIGLLQTAICDTNEFYIILLFAEKVKDANKQMILDALEQKVKECFPDPTDDQRKAWLDKIDTARFGIIVDAFRTKGIKGVRENIDLLSAIKRGEESPGLPTR